jgi:multimeric flavodoxin WrbA
MFSVDPPERALVKRVTAFVGSARRQHTLACAQQFLDELRAMGDVETEVVRLSDCRIETCRGCKRCFDRGEEHCPYAADDRDALIARMMSSDGVVFASPVYTWQVSAVMKKFLDRLGFVCHRPRFFGKAFTSIVVQGIHGGRAVVKYLDFVGMTLGFEVVRGSCLTTIDPLTDEARARNDRVLAAHASRFHARLSRPLRPAPTFAKLVGFRMARTSMRIMLGEDAADHRYYRDHGWFESDYYYPVRLGPLKRATGRLIDLGAARSARHGVVGLGW